MVLTLATALLLCSIAALAQSIAGPAALSLQRRWLLLETSEHPAHQYSEETSSPHARQLRPVLHQATPHLPPPPPPPPPPPQLQQQSSSASRQRRQGQLTDYPDASPLAVLAKTHRRRQLDGGGGLSDGGGEEGDGYPEITFGPNGEGHL